MSVVSLSETYYSCRRTVKACLSHTLSLFTPQWLDGDHPDPFGDQLACLQSVLRRMMNGQIESIQASWIQQFAFNSNPTLRKKDMMAALPHMFLWLGAYKHRT